MQYLAASKQLMMFLQMVSSQLAIETALDTKHGQGGGDGGGDCGGGTSFRRQRGVRAKRGESIKKAKSHYYERKDEKQGNLRANVSDLSSDESSSTSCDSGRYTNSSRSCSSRNSYVTNNLSRQELARKGVELVRQVKVWCSWTGKRWENWQV